MWLGAGISSNGFQVASLEVLTDPIKLCSPVPEMKGPRRGVWEIKVLRPMSTRKFPGNRAVRRQVGSSQQCGTSKEVTLTRGSAHLDKTTLEFSLELKMSSCKEIHSINSLGFICTRGKSFLSINCYTQGTWCSCLWLGLLSTLPRRCDHHYFVTKGVRMRIHQGLKAAGLESSRNEHS